jgi:hypothetical protein
LETVQLLMESNPLMDYFRVIILKLIEESMLEDVPDFFEKNKHHKHRYITFCFRGLSDEYIKNKDVEKLKLLLDLTIQYYNETGSESFLLLMDQYFELLEHPGAEELLNSIILHPQFIFYCEQILVYFTMKEMKTEMIQFLREMKRNSIYIDRFTTIFKIISTFCDWGDSDFALEYYQSIPFEIKSEKLILKILNCFLDAGECGKVLDNIHLVKGKFSIEIIQKFICKIVVYFENKSPEEKECMLKQLYQAFIILRRHEKLFGSSQTFCEIEQKIIFFQDAITLTIKELLKLNRLEVVIKRISVGDLIEDDELYFKIYTSLFKLKEFRSCNILLKYLKDKKNFKKNFLNWMFFKNCSSLHSQQAEELFQILKSRDSVDNFHYQAMIVCFWKLQDLSKMMEYKAMKIKNL